MSPQKTTCYVIHVHLSIIITCGGAKRCAVRVYWCARRQQSLFQVEANNTPIRPIGACLMSDVFFCVLIPGNRIPMTFLRDTANV